MIILVKIYNAKDINVDKLWKEKTPFAGGLRGLEYYSSDSLAYTAERWAPLLES